MRDRTRAYAAAPAIPLPARAGAPAGERDGRRARAGARPESVVRDLRGRAGRTPRELGFAEGDLVVVSGLPGSGKSTLMRRVVPGPRADSQETREHWAARLPGVPYVLYRPLARLDHYRGLRRALRTGRGLVVHDCGTQAWVRRWLAREAARRGRGLHLLLLDVDPERALAGQRTRGRRVSRYAFARHRRAAARLLSSAAAGALPHGCTSAVLLDREAADRLTVIRLG
ncbi:TGBp1 family protein [Streptomyces sp. SCSIO ZS0520]|uniref:TGBp1 family protein n=1 Tax=Streptomyces sp. SCSIO ZS0520 TaxID=2892996 RepID=UPI0021DA742C|nr:TGBp1 family protein [Streptomyces sp. SCSIO ZS0520]